MHYSRPQSFRVLHFRNAAYPNNNCALWYGQRPTYTVGYDTAEFYWRLSLYVARLYSSLSARQCLIVGAKHLGHDTTAAEDWTFVRFGLCTPPFSFQNLTRDHNNILYLLRNLLPRLSQLLNTPIIITSVWWLRFLNVLFGLFWYIFLRIPLDTCFFHKLKRKTWTTTFF